MGEFHFLARVGPTPKLFALCTKTRTGRNLWLLSRKPTVFRDRQQRTHFWEWTALNGAVHAREAATATFEFQKLVESGTSRLRNHLWIKSTRRLMRTRPTEATAGLQNQREAACGHLEGGGKLRL